MRWMKHSVLMMKQVIIYKLVDEFQTEIKNIQIYDVSVSPNYSINHVESGDI